MDNNYIGEYIVIKNQNLIKINRPQSEKPSISKILFDKGTTK